MDLHSEKAWMVRQDGTAFPCVCHVYGNPEDIEETLFAAQWLYRHTAKESTRDLCLRLFKTYGVSLSEHRNCVRSILIRIRKTPYRFLDYDFIYDLTDEIQNAAPGVLSELHKAVDHALNNEFMRVRYGGMYDSEAGKRDLYFRLSGDDLLTEAWKNVIRGIIREHKAGIDEVIVVSDEESTGECKRLLLTENE